MDAQTRHIMDVLKEQSIQMTAELFDSVTEEELKKLSKKDYINKMKELELEVSKHDDNIVDILENAYKDVLDKHNIWMEYPMDMSSKKFDKLTDFAIVVNGETGLVNLTECIIFPLITECDAVEIGELIVIVTYKQDLVLMFIHNNTLQKKYKTLAEEIKKDFDAFVPQMDKKSMDKLIWYTRAKVQVFDEQLD
jgi:hypothetical protein